MEHLIIPELKTAFISESELYSLNLKDCFLIDLCKYTNNEIIEKNRDSINLSSTTAQELLENGVTILYNAKQLYYEMEKYYVPHMDFDREKIKLQEVYDRIWEIKK